MAVYSERKPVGVIIKGRAARVRPAAVTVGVGVQLNQKTSANSARGRFQRTRLKGGNSEINLRLETASLHCIALYIVAYSTSIVSEFYLAGPASVRRPERNMMELRKVDQDAFRRVFVARACA